MPTLRRIASHSRRSCEHCRVVHGDKHCVIQTRKFKNAKECEVWKESVAKTHFTVWQLNYAGSRSKKSGIKYYRCSRTVGNHVRGISELKTSGTMTMVHYCTSFLKEIYSRDGKITAVYCTRHINHDVSPAKLPLSNTDKAVIASYALKGHDAAVIRDMIRQVVTDPRAKLHWVLTGEIEKVLMNIRLNKGTKEAATNVISIGR
ncbi:hypothetical protein COOONC_11360 [Cooperia oncophora]